MRWCVRASWWCAARCSAEDGKVDLNIIEIGRTPQLLNTPAFAMLLCAQAFMKGELTRHAVAALHSGRVAIKPARL